MSVGQLLVFLKKTSLNFSEIIHEARGPKTDKAKFSRKIFILGKASKNPSKIGVLGSYEKFNPLMSLLTLKILYECSSWFCENCMYAYMGKIWLFSYGLKCSS